ncbi:hypothetical protein PFWH6_2620 [Pseudomonas fluorescens WH6]|nr:hypothetical protein PFWH6_2620 [Pseudomonas fluorescens WH6]
MRCTKIALSGFNPQRNGVFITEPVGHRTAIKTPMLYFPPLSAASQTRAPP